MNVTYLHSNSLLFVFKLGNCFCKFLKAPTKTQSSRVRAADIAMPTSPRFHALLTGFIYGREVCRRRDLAPRGCEWTCKYAVEREAGKVRESSCPAATVLWMRIDVVLIGGGVGAHLTGASDVRPVLRQTSRHSKHYRIAVGKWIREIPRPPPEDATTSDPLASALPLWFMDKYRCAPRRRLMQIINHIL